MPFGTYTVDIALLEFFSFQVIGTAPSATVTLSSDFCSWISPAGDCVQRLVFVIDVD